MEKKRIQQSLILRDEEVSLIKSLLQRDDMNDQMVQSMFSHLGRTINHREISYIRNGNLKYSHIEPALENETKIFLNKYKQTEISLKQSGLLPSEKYFQRLCKSREAMLAAVSIYNDPNITFKTEIFITNCIIAWTYLLHAKLQSEDISFCYAEKKTKHGEPLCFELGKCLRLNEIRVDKATNNNLDYLLEVRHEIEHRMTENIDASMSSKIQACVLNFNDYIDKWFGSEYRIDHLLPFSIQMSEISLSQYSLLKGKKGLPSVIEAINTSFEGGLSDEEVSDPRYSYKLYLVPRTANRKNSADQTAEFIHPETQKGRDLQFAIKEVEKKKYTPSEVVKIMQLEGFRWFRQHEMTKFWKSIDGKNTKKGYGVVIGKRWFWYDHFLPIVRKHCKEKGRN